MAGDWCGMMAMMAMTMVVMAMVIVMVMVMIDSGHVMAVVVVW